MATGSIKREQSISSDEKEESKPYAATYTLDTAAILVAAEDVILTPEEANRLRRKIDWHILPLMFGEPTFASLMVRVANSGTSPLRGSVHGQKHPGVFCYLGNPTGYKPHDRRVSRESLTIPPSSETFSLGTIGGSVSIVDALCQTSTNRAPGYSGWGPYSILPILFSCIPRTWPSKGSRSASG